eukprot:scaffold345_cov134-Cylindrotheca_fusiformis.AAC.51
MERYDEFELFLAGRQQVTPGFLISVAFKTLCCRIDPKQASITKLDILNERVLEEYPSYEENYFFEMQGKPLNGMTCNSLMWMDGSTVFVQYRNRGGCFMVSLTVLTIIMAAIVGSTCTCGLSLLIVPLLLPLLFILPLFCL